MLILEDPGGEPLDRLLGQPMELSWFLRYPPAIVRLKAERTLAQSCRHRPVQYLSNVRTLQELMVEAVKRQRVGD
jgi:hypothetical protein